MNLRRIDASAYFDKGGATRCPECGDYLEPIGFRRELVNFKDFVEFPLLRCRDCKRVFAEDKQ